MRVRIGYLEQEYGTVEDTPDGRLHLSGNLAKLRPVVRGLRSAHGSRLRAHTAAQFVATLPTRLHGYTWAAVDSAPGGSDDGSDGEAHLHEHAHAEPVLLAGKGTDAAADSDPLTAWRSGVAVRVGLQAELTWAGLQDGYAAAGATDPANPFQFLYWVLGPVRTQHCDSCLRLAANSPYNAPGSGGNELNQTPGDGRTDCGASCHCELSYRPAGALLDEAQQAVRDRQFASFFQQFQDMPPVGELSYPVWRDVTGRAPAQAPVPSPYTSYGAGGGEEGENALYPEGLNAGQKRALDGYRRAYYDWERVRGTLVPAPRFFGDTDLLGRDTLPVPWESLTAAQQGVVRRMISALYDWSVATADEARSIVDEPQFAPSDTAPPYGGGSSFFTDRADEVEARDGGDDETFFFGLPGGGQPQGYQQPRASGGKFTTGHGRQPAAHHPRETVAQTAHAAAEHAAAARTIASMHQRAVARRAGDGAGADSNSKGGKERREERTTSPSAARHARVAATTIAPPREGATTAAHPQEHSGLRAGAPTTHGGEEIHGGVAFHHTPSGDFHADITAAIGARGQIVSPHHAVRVGAVVDAYASAHPRVAAQQARVAARYHDYERALAGSDLAARATAERALREAGMQWHQAYREVAYQHLQQIREFGGKMKADAGSRADANDLKAATAHYPREWVEESNSYRGYRYGQLQVRTVSVGATRGGQYHLGASRIEIGSQMAPEARSVVMDHELAHHFGKVRSHVQEMANEYYGERTRGELSVRDPMFPNSLIKRDAWKDIYQGLDTRDPEFNEVFSVGMEGFVHGVTMRGTSVFEDRQALQFTLGLLAAG